MEFEHYCSGDSVFFSCSLRMGNTENRRGMEMVRKNRFLRAISGVREGMTSVPLKRPAAPFVSNLVLNLGLFGITVVYKSIGIST